MDAEALFAEGGACLRANRLAEARDLFRRAGEAGSRKAAVIYCNLVASVVDWEEGLRLLRVLARTSPRCRRELGIVEAMAPGPPAAGEVLSDAPLFRNALADGTRDPAAAHAGLPVIRGEKLIASRWIRARPFEPPSGERAA